MDDFTRHYLIAALWASTDDNGEPMDELFGIEDIAPETVQSAIKDCAQFQKTNAEALARVYPLYFYHPDAPTPQCAAGHDFWLTRNGHGAGFWDRGFDKWGETLTDAAKAFGNVDFYVGDDGLIH